MGDIVVDEDFTVLQQNEADVFLSITHLFSHCYADNWFLFQFMRKQRRFNCTLSVRLGNFQLDDFDKTFLQAN